MLFRSFGIQAYLTALLISQAILFCMDFFVVNKYTGSKFQLKQWFVIPFIPLFILGFILRKGYEWMIQINHTSDVIALFLACSVYFLAFILILLKLKIISTGQIDFVGYMKRRKK